MLDDFFVRALIAGIGVAFGNRATRLFCSLEKIVIFW
jgi:hypothetical protein